MNDNRYQFQTRYIKAIRWMRHMPVAYVCGACRMIRACFWIFKTWKWCVNHVAEMELEMELDPGTIVIGDYFWSIFWLPWQSAISRGEVAMDHWYTMEESF